jgi:4'-phosphopantetheinyl transferase
VNLSQVSVWFRRTDRLPVHDIAEAERTLSTNERARADRFCFPDDRRDYVVAHDLLRRCLSRYDSTEPAAWQFDEGPHGRLFVRRDRGQPPIFFSLTHTSGVVACAIGREELIGVDVERTSRALTRLDIGTRILSPAEVHALDRCDESERRLRLFELWTLKEACAKATGEGFLIGFRGLSFSIDGPDIGFAPPESLSTHRWSFALFAPTPDSRLAVAIGQGGPEPAQVSVRDADAEGLVLASLRATREDFGRP